jgi:hypothetical protein
LIPKHLTESAEADLEDRIVQRVCEEMGKLMAKKLKPLHA